MRPQGARGLAQECRDVRVSRCGRAAAAAAGRAKLTIVVCCWSVGSVWGVFVVRSRGRGARAASRFSSSSSGRRRGRAAPQAPPGTASQSQRPASPRWDGTPSIPLTEVSRTSNSTLLRPICTDRQRLRGPSTSSTFVTLAQCPQARMHRLHRLIHSRVVAAVSSPPRLACLTLGPSLSRLECCDCMPASRCSSAASASAPPLRLSPLAPPARCRCPPSLARSGAGGAPIDGCRLSPSPEKSATHRPCHAV